MEVMEVVMRFGAAKKNDGRIAAGPRLSRSAALAVVLLAPANGAVVVTAVYVWSRETMTSAAAFDGATHNTRESSFAWRTCARIRLSVCVHSCCGLR